MSRRQSLFGGQDGIPRLRKCLRGGTAFPLRGRCPRARTGADEVVGFFPPHQSLRDSFPSRGSHFGQKKRTAILSKLPFFLGGQGGIPRLRAGPGSALTSALPQMPFPGFAVKARPEKRRGCGNSGFASSAPGGAKPQFPRRSIHSLAPRIPAGNAKRQIPAGWRGSVFWICYTVLIEFPAGGCTACSGGCISL